MAMYLSERNPQHMAPSITPLKEIDLVNGTIQLSPHTKSH